MQSFLFFMWLQSLTMSSFFLFHHLRRHSVIIEESPSAWPPQSMLRMKSWSRAWMFSVALQTGSVSSFCHLSIEAFSWNSYFNNCTMARAPLALGVRWKVRSTSITGENIWSVLFCNKCPSIISKHQNEAIIWKRKSLCSSPTPPLIALSWKKEKIPEHDKELCHFLKVLFMAIRWSECVLLHLFLVCAFVFVWVYAVQVWLQKDTREWGTSWQL